MEKSDVLFRPKLPVFAKRLSEKDIGGLKQMFKMIDADNNGTIMVISTWILLWNESSHNSMLNQVVAVVVPSVGSSEAYRENNDRKMKKVNRGPLKPVDLSIMRRSSRVGDKPPQASGRPIKVVDILPEDYNDYFSLRVSFTTQESNHLLLPRLKVPVLYITGDEDPLCFVQVLEDIEGNNVGGSRVVVLKGRGRSFVHRPASAEDDQDAEEAFTIMRNWSSRRVPSKFDNGNTDLLQPPDFTIHNLHWFFIKELGDEIHGNIVPLPLRNLRLHQQTRWFLSHPQTGPGRNTCLEA
nr:carboxymethylenebutenolidase homolog [Tanacetum cinerariifolium]